MLYKFFYAFIMIFNRQRIPKLPRGMLASKYEQVSSDERRVMARVGSRDPAGVRLAMKRAGVKTVEELIELLEHQTPVRNFRHRLWVGIGRLVGGEDANPHAAEIAQINRPRKKSTAEIEQRLKEVRRRFK